MFYILAPTESDSRFRPSEELKGGNGNCEVIEKAYDVLLEVFMN